MSNLTNNQSIMKNIFKIHLKRLISPAFIFIFLRKNVIQSVAV